MNALIALLIGERIGERARERAPREGSSAIGWVVALIVLLVIIKFDHVDLRPHDAHGVARGAVVHLSPSVR